MRTALEQSFWDRLAGVLTLQRPAYEAISRDAEATGQAWLIVLLLGLAEGMALITAGPVLVIVPGMSEELVAALTEAATALTFESNERRLLALALGVAGTVVWWYVSSWLLRLVGVRVTAGAGRDITPEQMRRLVAWGRSPALASFLAPIPGVGPLLFSLGSLWSLVTGVMAVRAAFDVGVGKAIAIAIAAVLLALGMVVLIAFVALLLAWPLA
jgi:hypothetical protein